MNLKTERFEMRIDPGMLERVDNWRARQADLPSRAEAMRRLMETGLATAEGKPIRFSDGEKLITLMLCELYKHLGNNGEIDRSFVEAVLCDGHYWGLEWKYPHIFHGEGYSQETVSEVVDVLNMWRSIEWSHAKLSKHDKERVENEAALFGERVEFRGFDGNEESEHLSVTEFLINKLDRFAEFKGRDLNSMPKLDDYRRMLPVFESMRRGLRGGGHLGAAQIIKLLNVQLHDRI